MIERDMILMDTSTRSEWCQVNGPRMAAWMNQRLSSLPSTTLSQVWLPREAYVTLTEGFTSMHKAVESLGSGLRTLVVFRVYDDDESISDDGGLNFVLLSFGADSFAREVVKMLRAEWPEFESACESADTEWHVAGAGSEPNEAAQSAHVQKVFAAGDRLKREMACCLQRQINFRASSRTPFAGGQ